MREVRWVEALRLRPRALVLMSEAMLSGEIDAPGASASFAAIAGFGGGGAGFGAFGVRNPIEYLLAIN
jgi:hypothetical protein